MNNKSGRPNRFKDVIREKTENSIRPDYTFRIDGRKLFHVEAKKPYVNISTCKESSYQARQYGWNAGLPVSILTNFNELRVYDTTIMPNKDDDPDVALICKFNFEEYESKHELLHYHLSKDANSLRFDASQGIRVNENFLTRMQEWRELLAQDFHSRFSEISEVEINDLSQLFINRLVFIRMCEDRGIEAYATLKKVSDAKDEIKIGSFFSQMNKKYNSSLFKPLDEAQKKYTVQVSTFEKIVNELYEPTSPYNFAILDADFLGQVYENFLHSHVTLINGEMLLQKKNPKDKNEVVTTPQLVVNTLVEKTFDEYMVRVNEDDLIEKLKDIKIMDMATGSGRFLIKCFEVLVDKVVEAYQAVGDTDHIHEIQEGVYALIFQEKKKILQNCFYALDIDYSAVEITKFSLLVKLLEDETVETLPKLDGLLPDLNENIVWGNAIIVDDGISPRFDYDSFKTSNFDIIVGNPPYVKAEDMKNEKKYLRENYESSAEKINKYFIFIEKALAITSKDAVIGVIVSNRWIASRAAKKLRKYISENASLSILIDFGKTPIFPQKSVYCVICVFDKSKSKNINHRHVDNLDDWHLNPMKLGYESLVDETCFSDGSTWVIPSSAEEEELLNKLSSRENTLGEFVNATVGIQTSATNIYNITLVKDHGSYIEFVNGYKKHGTIEKSILRRLVRPKHITSYKKIDSEMFVIFPYEKHNNKSVCLEPTTMKEKFPMAWKYLNSYHDKLLPRPDGPRDVKSLPKNSNIFYSYGRSTALNEILCDVKILFGVNQLHGKYALDTENRAYASGGTAGVASITEKTNYSVYFILGLLNQRFIEFFLRKRGEVLERGYYARGCTMMRTVPMPNIDFENEAHIAQHESVCILVKSILETEGNMVFLSGRLKTLEEDKVNRLKDELSRIFLELYELPSSANLIRLPGE